MYNKNDFYDIRYRATDSFIMSKTTVTLIIILLVFLGLLLFTIYGVKENPIIITITRSLQNKIIPAETELSLTTDSQSLKPGQTDTIAVLLTKINPLPNIAEIELAYDPNVISVDSVSQGSFFTNPIVALQTIDPVIGRISYALRCPTIQNSSEITECANPSSRTLATVTVSVNPNALQNTTKLTFLPRTVVRIKNGRDVLKNATGLTLTIGNVNASSPAVLKIPFTTEVTITPAL